MGGFAVGARYQAPNFTSIPDQFVEEILVHPDAGAMFKVGVQLAAGYPNIMAGDVLGMITTAGPNQGKYRRYTGGTAKNVQVAGDSVVIMTGPGGKVMAPAFLPGEIIDIGAIVSKTVASVTPSTGQITIAGTLGAAVAIGDVIKLHTTDGSGTAACIAARPVSSAFYRPDLPDVNNLLDTDYLIDGIWQGILKQSVLRGLDAAAMTALAALTLQPYMDAVLIR